MEGVKSVEDVDICPITYNNIKKYASLNGRYYELYAIVRWVRLNNTDPCTRAICSLSDIIIKDTNLPVLHRKIYSIIRSNRVQVQVQSQSRLGGYR